MATPKTVPTSVPPQEFIVTLSDRTQQSDSLELLAIMEKVTKAKVVMWGTSIIGFGTYNYISKSNPKGALWPIIGFSPRKGSITLYLMKSAESFKSLIDCLGEKVESKGSCVYIKTMKTINKKVLEDLIGKAYNTQ